MKSTEKTSEPYIVDALSLRLHKPLTLNVKGGTGSHQEEIEVLELSEPTAGQLELASASDNRIGGVITLISLVSGQPRGLVLKLCQRDFEAAAHFLGSFTGLGASDGASPSPT